MTLSILSHTPPYHQLSFTPKLSKTTTRSPPPGIRRFIWPHMEHSTVPHPHHPHNNKTKTKLVVIMGATGTGKSRLSIDLATRYFTSSEVINSDKMQVYSGLEITTNKIPLSQRCSIPHHLLGSLPSPPELSPISFRHAASSLISSLASSSKLPLLVGGSNSFIYSLLSTHYTPGPDVFYGSGRVMPELCYDCCFIWVDVAFSVLEEYLIKRVDDMLESGMFNELAEFYKSDPVGYSSRVGITKAIGVPEFEGYFRRFLIGGDNEEVDEVEERECYERAVKEIKDNTCRLAKRQIEKILRLRDGGWDLNRLDATDAFRAVMTSDPRADDVWEKCVLEPSVKIVKRFLA